MLGSKVGNLWFSIVSVWSGDLLPKAILEHLERGEGDNPCKILFYGWVGVTSSLKKEPES